MCPLPGPGPVGPLVITGMHRSGTSLLTSMFAGAGVDVGSRLIGASRGNDRGHWEDLDFYEFHAGALEANGVASEGFACADDLRVPAAMRDTAAALVAGKAAAGATWGWKDPRTTLFLDFWHDLVPEAAFVFVFRSPWEVADSLFRRGDAIFARNPALAVRVWLHYNRRIHDFCAAHRSRCVLTSVTQVTVDPASVFAAVRDRFDVPLGEPPARFEEPLLQRDDSSRRREIVAALEPEAVALYGDMLRLADLADATAAPRPRTSGGTLAEHALAEWSRAAASAGEIKAADAARQAAEVSRAAAEAHAAAEARSAVEAHAAAEARVAEAAQAASRATAAAHAAIESGAPFIELERDKRAAEGRARELQALVDELSLQVQRLALAQTEPQTEPQTEAEAETDALRAA